MPTTAKKRKKAKQPAYDGEPFKSLVREAMKRQDQSIADVELGSGIGDRTTRKLSRWLGGTRDMYVSDMKKLLDYLDLKVGAYSNKSTR